MDIGSSFSCTALIPLESAGMNDVRVLARVEKEGAKYDVTHFYKETGLAQQIARSKGFSNMSAFAICLWLVWLSIDVDHNAASSLKSASAIFQLAYFLFAAYCSLDIVIRLLAFKLRRHALSDAWIVLDFTLTLLLVLSVLVSLTTDSSSSLLGFIGLLQAARVGRLVRLLPELGVLIKGFFAALRAMFFCWLLLAVVIYIFALVFMRLIERDTELQAAQFKSVPDTMHSLLLHGVFLSDFAGFAYVLKDEAWGLEVVFFIFTSLAVAIIVIMFGVLCEVVSTVAGAEKDRYSYEHARDLLVSELDSFTGCDGSITRKELETYITEPNSCRILQSLGCNVTALLDSLDIIFKDGGDIRLADFIETVLEMRETSAVTKKDIFILRAMIQKLASKGNGIDSPTLEPTSRASLSSDDESDARARKVVEASLAVSMQAVQAAIANPTAMDITKVDITQLTQAIQDMRASAPAVRKPLDPGLFRPMS
mmetsp:Transcript_118430/g.334836  ORF Transcript_118430/g.334836 Transcript_118430/m.334836 type:complete len:482 (-) Transcript_118430:97-1542(-)